MRHKQIGMPKKQINTIAMAQKQIDKRIKSYEKQYETQVMEQINNITPAVYAAIALVLKKHYRWTTQKICNLFSESAEEWTNILSKGESMLNYVEKETNIRIQLDNPYESFKDMSEVADGK